MGMVMVMGMEMGIGMDVQEATVNDLQIKICINWSGGARSGLWKKAGHYFRKLAN